MGLWGSSVGGRGVKANLLTATGSGNGGSGRLCRAHGGDLVSQNNQLQELPYNELSRLSSLRTLNLHNNLISSEGEGRGDPGRRPLPSPAGSVGSSAVVPRIALC